MNLLRDACRAPSRGDLIGVAACVAVHATVIASAALLHHAAGGGVQMSDADPVPALGLFAHNAAVFFVWVAGAFTFGLMTVLVAGFGALETGLSLGGALEVHGWDSLRWLGHALVEVPAFSVAIWLSVRPAVHAWRSSLDGPGQSPAWWHRSLRSALTLVGVALALLVVAAVWEGTVSPPG